MNRPEAVMIYLKKKALRKELIFKKRAKMQNHIKLNKFEILSKNMD